MERNGVGGSAPSTGAVMRDETCMERARGHRSIGVTASGNACRRRGWLMTLLLASVAIATVAAATPAMAQVTVQGDVTPNPWTPADALTVGNTGSGSLVIE